MKPRFTLGLAFATALLLTTAAFGQEYQVETIGAPEGDVPQAIKDAVSSEGLRVTGGEGTVCDIWLRKEIPTRAASGLMAVMFDTLAPGTFLGLVHFPNERADFRGQPLRPGFYTLRYVLIPTDGAHMGVYQTRDAAVLGPVAEDAKPEENLKYNDLVALGKKASGAPHPAFLVLSEAQGGNPPAVVKGHHDNWNLLLKANGSEGELTFGLTVVGVWAGE